MTLTPNKNLSFCTGANIGGETQPFDVGSRARHTHLFLNLILSIERKKERKWQQRPLISHNAKRVLGAV